MAGDSKAARARVEARGMSPVHLTAMHGEVLGREGQRLPFLESKDTKMIYTEPERSPSTIHYSKSVKDLVIFRDKQEQSEKAQLTSLSWGLMAVKGACWLRWGELPSMAE